VRPLSFGQAVVFSLANFGSNMTYQLLNFGAALYLLRYPEVPPWAVGLLSQERSLAGALVQPVVGAISDRTRTPIGRRKPFFILGVALTAASLLFLATFPPLAPMLLVLAVNAFFLNVAVDPYMALQADVVPQDQRGRIGAALAIFALLGAFSMTIFASQAWDRSPGLVFVVCAVGLIVTWTVTTVGVREPATPPRPHEPLRMDVAGYLRDLASRRELLKYVFAILFYWLGSGGVVPFITRFGTEVLGMQEGESFLLAAPALVGGIFGALAGGYLADRRGKQPVIAVAMLVLAIGAGIAGLLVATTAQAYAALGLLGLANGAVFALLVPLLVDLVPPERAAEMTGLGSGLWSLSQPVGAFAAGVLIQVTANYRSAFVGAAALILLSFLILLTVRQSRRRASEAAH
jgi:maltose/moltooligosaccharide transporter